MSAENEVPELRVVPTPAGPTAFGLEGWDEFERWAYHNSAIWHAVLSSFAGGMLSELDKLRLLAGQMLKQNVILTEQMLTVIRSCPQQVLIPPPLPMSPDRTQPENNPT